MKGKKGQFVKGHTVNLGREHTQETKDKMSKTRKAIVEAGGEIGRPFKKGDTTNLGRHHSKEAKDKMSKAKAGKYVGDNNPNWVGGRLLARWTWRHSPKGKAYFLKHAIKHFDYIYNNWFEGCVLHHMRYTYPVIGMFIPVAVHQPYTLNLGVANTKAFEWFFSTLSKQR